MATLAPKVVFARVGWLERYEGPSLTEPRPQRGGSYNKTNVGYEIFNYQPLDGKFYGYFQSPGKEGRVSLSRIDPAASEESLSGVRIVWVATKDDGGQVVVGWYDDATLFGEAHDYPAGVRDGFWYKCVADPTNAVLLHPNDRTWSVPVGRNGLGQANVLYPIDEDGRSRLQSPEYGWMARIMEQIDTYQRTADEGSVAESVAAVAGGQGFLSDPTWRRNLEKHAMDAALRHFKDEGYDSKDEHKGHPYDLRCTKGPEVLFVEVKGTTTGGDSVLVTSGEVRFARKNAPGVALFVLHSVERDGAGLPISGKAAVVRPWDPSDDSLSPIAYTFTRAG